MWSVSPSARKPTTPLNVGIKSRQTGEVVISGKLYRMTPEIHARTIHPRIWRCAYYYERCILVHHPGCEVASLSDIRLHPLQRLLVMHQGHSIALDSRCTDLSFLVFDVTCGYPYTMTITESHLFRVRCHHPCSRHHGLSHPLG